MKRLLTIFIFCLVVIITNGCSGKKSSKGYDYARHRKDNAERVQETRERNKKSKNLLNHKGKSVKKPKPEYP